MADDDVRMAAKELMLAGFKYFYDEGEVQMVMAKQFGKAVLHMSAEEMRKGKKWLENNHFRKTRILQPDYHQELMKTENEYSKWFNACLKQAESRIVGAADQAIQSRKDFA